VDGLRDSVRPGQTGAVTDVNTPAALAAQVAGLLQDPARYERLRTQAWEWSRTITFEQSYRDFQRVISRAVRADTAGTEADQSEKEYSSL
jgi:glycosyltransferase involved in cell wall biosynthesis